MSINERSCTDHFMVTFSGGLPPPRTPRPCAPRSTAYCLKRTYLTAAFFSSMAPKSANFARKNRIATILCVHHHFPDFRKPSRNIVQIGAEFERKMADLFRKNLDISRYIPPLSLIRTAGPMVRERGVTPERFNGNPLAAMDGTGPMGNAIV